MKIDGGIGTDLQTVAAQAAKAEADGYDGVFTGETSHDPFLPIAVGGQRHHAASTTAPASRWPSPATR